MARTYRHRRQPRFGVDHYVDGGTKGAADKWKAKVEQRVRLIAPMVPPGSRLRYWGLYWEAKKKAEQQIPRPAAGVAEHPWVPFWRMPGPGVKKYYRTEGNRRVRRGNRSQLNGLPQDEAFDEDRFLGKQDGWNLWDLF